MEPEEMPEGIPGGDEEPIVPSLDTAKKSLIKSGLGWKLGVVVVAVILAVIMIRFFPKAEDTTSFVDSQTEGVVDTETRFVSSCQGSAWFTSGCKGPPSDDVIASAEGNIGTTDEATIRRLCQCWS
ncbi:MAG: hypothetical protein ABH829_05320 [archaeon]